MAEDAPLSGVLLVEYVNAAVDRHAAHCAYMEADDVCGVAHSETDACVARVRMARVECSAALRKWQRIADISSLMSSGWERAVLEGFTNRCPHGEQRDAVDEMCCRRVIMQRVLVELADPEAMNMDFDMYWERHANGVARFAEMRRGVQNTAVRVERGTSVVAKDAIRLFHSFVDAAVGLLDWERKLSGFRDGESVARDRMASAQAAYDCACTVEDDAYRAFIGACDPTSFEVILERARSRVRDAGGGGIQSRLGAVSSRGNASRFQIACAELLLAVGRCGLECPVGTVRVATANCVAKCWTLMCEVPDEAWE